jgi:hypothetical protein
MRSDDHELSTENTNSGIKKTGLLQCCIIKDYFKIIDIMVRTFLQNVRREVMNWCCHVRRGWSCHFKVHSSICYVAECVGLCLIKSCYSNS